MNTLNSLYKAMLNAWNTKVNDDYSLSMVLDNQAYPVTIDEKNVYLPTDSALDTNTIDKVFFHPACESIISGETEIFKVIRKLTGMRLLVAFISYPEVLFNIAAKKSTKSMQGFALDILEPLKSVKGPEQKEIRELFNEMKVSLGEDNVDKRFIHFQVTKGGKSKETGGKIYYRVKPQFPFYTEMSRRLNRSDDLPRNQKVDVCGHRITLKALEVAVHIFRSILKSVDTPEEYTGESFKADGARLVAFCHSYALIADEMNNFQNLFRAEFDKVAIYGLDTSFTEELDNISDICRQVPSLPYNNQSSSNEPKGTNQQLINDVINTEARPQYTVNNAPNQPQQDLTQIQGEGPVNGFKQAVVAYMQPGEQYQAFYFDNQNNCYIHNTMSAQGPVIYRVTRQGTVLAREVMNTGMGYGGYNYYQMQQQQMMNQHMNGGNMGIYGGGAQPAVSVQPSYGYNNAGNGSDVVFS